MTTEQRTDTPTAIGSGVASSGARARRRPSVHVQRARKLLFGGLAGGLVATVLCLILFGVLDGAPGLRSVVLAAGLVLFFYVVGQLVMVAFADAGARTLLAVSMASYTARVVVLGLVLLAYSRDAHAWPTLIPMALFLTTALVVAGWLIVEVVVFSRLRIEVYDSGYADPTPREGEQ